MMTFYTAVGSYQFKLENGRHMPYILRMGRLEPVSVPEFFIWSHLLWEVETYYEIRKDYMSLSGTLGVHLPDFDQALNMLVKRKLVAKGIGYTGEDALYDMLSGVFVLPVQSVGMHRLGTIVKTLFKGKITVLDALRLLKPEPVVGEELRVLKLVRQTPLSVSELIRCFDYGVRRVRTPDMVIDAIYTEEEDTQERIRIASRQSEHRTQVLQAAANLYLRHRVMLDMA